MLPAKYKWLHFSWATLYVCTKFEADSSIHSKVIKGVPRFRNWVTRPQATLILNLKRQICVEIHRGIAKSFVSGLIHW